MTTQATGAGQFSKQIKVALAVIAQRSASALSPTPGRVVLLAPGNQVAHDDCCNGQVWSRLVSLAPMPSNDPARRPGTNPCAVPELLLTAELGIVRCAATVNDHGEAPSARQITADGEQSVDDMSALLGVLRCTDNLRSLISWTPTGPEGGCHGGYWTYTMRVPNCLGCEEVEG